MSTVKLSSGLEAFTRVVAFFPHCQYAFDVDIVVLLLKEDRLQ
jgi:hypothetical protein